MFPIRRPLLLPLLIGLLPSVAPAQQDSARVVAGERYATSDLGRTLLGADYRGAWTTPVVVPVLDLDTFAGGLEPVRRGGGHQTRSLRLRAADGREFNFRSIDKEITQGLPDWLKETLVDAVLQDQISSLHPAAAGVATELLDRVDVLNPGPRMVVLPDDPALGEFREDYAGMLGWIEVHANEGPDDQPWFADADVVAGTDRLLEHLEEDPGHRVDARAFLRARLMDILFGDWDRHAGQWRWARYGEEGDYRWVPVPEDRDYVFTSYDGWLARIGRATFVPRARPYTAEYPSSLTSLVVSADALDRRLLVELPPEAWDSAAAFIQSRLTDDALEAALRSMPAPWYEQTGPELSEILRARVADLDEVAHRFYAHVNRVPEVRATDEDDVATVARAGDGSVAVTLAFADRPDRPYFRREFDPSVTREIRVWMHGGDDRVTVTGGADDPILVRVVGGGGDDVLVDETQGWPGRVITALYDARGENTFRTGPATSVDSREYEEPAPERDVFSVPERDWGRSVSWFAPTVNYRGAAGGVIVGGGPTITGRGFRQSPYAYRVQARALVAPGSGRVGADFSGDFRRVGSAERLEVELLASQLEAIRFYGWGNETTAEGPSDRFNVQQDRIAATASYVVPLADSTRLSFGPTFMLSDSELAEGSVIEEVRPYGSSDFGQAGMRAALEIDRGEPSGFPRRGLRLDLTGSAYPTAWDVVEPFGSIRGVAALYATLPAGPRPVLAVRAGGAKVFGRFPVHEAAFLGGSRSLRGYSFQRFAGDGSLFAGAELRVPITEANLIVRGDLGASVFGDVGRVYYDGDDGGWHDSVGLSAWFTTPGPTVHASYAWGEEGKLYVGLGFPF